jgi:hypothetical protein
MNFTTNNRLISRPAVALLSLTMLLSGATQPLLAVPDPPGKAASRSGGIFPAGRPGDDTACKPVFDASDKLLSVSNHAYMAQNRDTPTGPKTENSESITVDGVRYILFRGKWTRSKVTPQETKAQEEENKKNAKDYTCHFVRNEAVNGEAAALYSAHNVTEDSTSDSQVWISRSRGLIVKQELVLDSGGKDAKDRWSIRYEYSNVKAPQI